ncbi:MAG TPA: DUF835 domain-containing protein [Thermoplasmata archaeon]|nr:DUF835 domain-containing protein [Thermoplasmata archaeon]
MRSPKPAFLTMVLALLVFWALVSPALGQGSGMTVSSDYELFGTTNLNGGGHVTWTLTGDAARTLRADIVHLYDEYPRVPQGFLFGGQATSGNHDGIIQVPEGQAFTNDAESILEATYPGSTVGGTQVGYFLLDRSTLLEKDLVNGFNRSTSGIVGMDANSAADLQIEFLFNGATNTADVTMPLTTEAYAQALFRVFSVLAAQAGSRPVVPAATGAPGWHVVFYDPSHPALWAGNTTSCSLGTNASCRYDNGANLSAATVMDSALGAAGTWLDLRFASSAWVTFNYTGQVADSGDVVRVQVATEAANLTWTTVASGTFSLGQNTAPGTWRPVSLNLSAYLGQKVRLRLQFTSDGAGTAPGFFVGGFTIHAPASYAGPIVESDAHYLIGLLSFSNFQVPSGNPTLIRTPGGEILFYSDRFDTASPSPDAVRYEAFNAMENPQVLFVVLVVAAYVISRLQDSAYDRYREAHPSVYRPAVHKAKWLHWLGRIAILLLILFYFVPTAFFVVGLRVYFNGPAYFFVALAASLTLGLGTRAYYRQRLEEAPPPGPAIQPADGDVEAGPEVAEEVEEAPAVVHCTHCLRTIHEGEQTYACSCGAFYHMSCAAGLMRCPNCRKPIAGIDRVGEKRSMSMRCSSCGEVQTVPEGADPRTLTCASCGGSLRSLDAGKRYLLVASNPAIAFHWLADLCKGGKPALVITPAAPDRLRLEFGLKGAQVVQVSAQAAGAVDPRKLDPVGLKAILPLAREGKAGVLLYDGLDQLVSVSSMGDVVRFLRKANDMAFVHQITVIGRVGPGVLAETEIDRLAAEFDEVLDLSARL